MHNYKPSPIRLYQNRFHTNIHLDGTVISTYSTVQSVTDISEVEVQAYHDRESPYRSCTSNTFSHSTYSFSAGGVCNESPLRGENPQNVLVGTEVT